MKVDLRSIVDCTDQELLAQAKALAAQERQATAQLIALLIELNARRLHLAEGYPSLFTYCTRALHLSEDAAYNRTHAARTAHEWPVVLEMLADGSLTLTNLRLIGPCLTSANHREVLENAKYKSKREVEQQVAALHPRPDTASTVRKLPAGRPATRDLTRQAPETPIEGPTPSLAPPPHSAPIPAPSLKRPVAVVAPLAPERYKVQLTVSGETHDKLRRVQDLLRHQVPNGDPAVIFERALTLLLEDLERKKLAQTARPRKAVKTTSASRHIPAAVRREVWKRDGGQCAFIGSVGRCTERGFLEVHHVVPFADGGPMTVENLQLRCRAHNQYEAQQHFGPVLLREVRAEYSPAPNGSQHQFCASPRQPPQFVRALSVANGRFVGRLRPTPDFGHGRPNGLSSTDGP